MIGGVAYQDVFFLKPSETAEIGFPEGYSFQKYRYSGRGGTAASANSTEGYRLLPAYIRFSVSDTGEVSLIGTPPEGVTLAASLDPVESSSAGGGAGADPALSGGGTGSSSADGQPESSSVDSRTDSPADPTEAIRYILTITNSRAKKIRFKKVDISDVAGSALRDAVFDLYRADTDGSGAGVSTGSSGTAAGNAAGNAGSTGTANGNAAGNADGSGAAAGNASGNAGGSGTTAGNASGNASSGTGAPLYTGLVSGVDGMLRDASDNTVFELPVGTYRLVETQAPEGYRLKENAVVITVAADDMTYIEGTNLSYNGSGSSYDEDTKTYTLKISNSRGYAMPSTGSPGGSHTGRLRLTGLLLLAVCILTFLRTAGR